MEWRAWVRKFWKMLSSSESLSDWEIMRDLLCQKFLTYHLPTSLLLPTDLSGLSIIVTGATNGIGLQTARELAMAGAHVIMACRNTKAANEIASSWREEAHNSKIPNVEVMELNLSSLSSVRKFAVEWENRGEPLHILINNAGIYLRGEPQKFSDDGLEQHIHVNHVAPALLTLLLLPSLLKAPSSRIINVNSVAHRGAIVEPNSWKSKIEEHNFNAMKAYGASKLAHLMFLKALASKLLEQKKDSIHTIAVHPGAVSTNIVPGMPKKSLFMFDAVEGARSVIFCATSADVTDNLVKGFAYYTSTCKPDRISPKAVDMDACFEVLQKTLEILQLDPNYLSNVLN